MTLQARPIHIAAAVGLDEGTREEHIAFGERSLSGVNVRHAKRGGLETRLGFGSALARSRTSGSDRSAGRKLFANGKQQCVVDGSTCDVYSPGLTKSASAGRVPEVGLTTIDLPANYSATATDMAVANGFIATVYQCLTTATTYSCVVVVVDSAGTEVHRSQLATGLAGPLTVEQPKIVALSDRYFICVYKSAAASTIVAYHLDTQALSTGWVQTGGAALATDAAVGFTRFAVEQLTAKAAIVYGNTSGGTARLTVKTFDTTGILETATTPVTTSSVTGGIDIAGTQGDTLWVGWNDGGTTNIKVVGYSTTTLATIVATQATLIVSGSALYTAELNLIPTTTGAGIAILNDIALGAVGGGFVTRHRAWTTAAGVMTPGAATVLVPNSMFVSRGFYKSGRAYVQVTSGDYSDGAWVKGIQQQIALVDATDVSATNQYLRPVVCHSMNVSTVASGFKPKCCAVGSLVYAVHNRKRSSLGTSQEVSVYDFADAERWQPAGYRGCTSLSGGVHSYFDGERILETGFLFRPPKIVTLTVIPAGSITATNGGMRYIAVYEHIDSAGNLTVSGASDPSAATGNLAGKYVDVEIAPCTVTSRFSDASSNVRIGLYRTTDGGEAPYYRVATLQNDTALAVLTYRDLATDAVLATGAKLYTQPGVLGTSQDRRAPPGCRHHVEYQTMLVVAQGRRYFWSGQPVDGEAVWFNPIFQGEVRDDITGLAVMDGTFFVFTRTGIYAIAGEPPADNATSGGLGAPRRLAVDVGCTNARSLCVSALGVFFLSERGIELLTRAQSVEWVGESIRDTLASFPIVSSAVVDARNVLVRFTLAASETSGVVSSESGKDLVFDLSLKQWVSTDEVTGASATRAAQSAAMVYQGSTFRYATLETNGQVRVENLATASDAYLDGTTWITPLWETAWCKFGLQQEQRLWNGVMLYERSGAAGLKLEIAYDYAAYSSANDKVWTEAETLSGLRQLPFRPKSRGQAMKFRFSATAPAVPGTGRGLSFVGLSLDMAPKQGSTTATPRLAPTLRK